MADFHTKRVGKVSNAFMVWIFADSFFYGRVLEYEPNQMLLMRIHLLQYEDHMTSLHEL